LAKASSVWLARIPWKADPEGVRRIQGHDVTAEGRLDELGLLTGQADNAAIVGVSDFAGLPEGGTLKAGEGGSVLLDCQVDGWSGHNDGYTPTLRVHEVEP